MLVHRLRRWPNIDPTLGERIVFVGKPLEVYDKSANGESAIPD